MTGEYYLKDALDEDARDNVGGLTPPSHVHLVINISIIVVVIVIYHHVHLATHYGQAQGLLGLPVHLHQPLVAPELGGGGLHLTLNKEKCFRLHLSDKVCQEYSDRADNKQRMS